MRVRHRYPCVPRSESIEFDRFRISQLSFCFLALSVYIALNDRVALWALLPRYTLRQLVILLLLLELFEDQLLDLRGKLKILRLNLRNVAIFCFDDCILIL